MLSFAQGSPTVLTGTCHQSKVAWVIVSWQAMHRNVYSRTQNIYMSCWYITYNICVFMRRILKRVCLRSKAAVSILYSPYPSDLILLCPYPSTDTVRVPRDLPSGRSRYTHARTDTNMARAHSCIHVCRANMEFSIANKFAYRSNPHRYRIPVFISGSAVHTSYRFLI